MSGVPGRRSVGTIVSLLLGTALALGCSEAHATVIVASPNVDFDTMPALIDLGPATYTLSAVPGALLGDAPAAVTTAGTGRVSSFGGGVADFGAGVTIDQIGALYDFSAFPQAATIPNSAADDYIGLAFTLGDGLHYGYAEIAGTTLVKYAYESIAGTGIVASVPEPSPFVLLGAGLVGLIAVRLPRSAGAVG